MRINFMIFMLSSVQLRIFKVFIVQCDCTVECNVIGHHMKYLAQCIRAQLTKYITKYIDAVCMVADEFLQGKGFTVEDYL